MAQAKLTISYDNIIDKLEKSVNRNMESARKAVMTQIAKDTDEYIPYKTGRLSKNIELTESTLAYTEDYASYAFNPISPSGVPKQYSKKVHEKAQGYPLQKSYNENDEKWAELFRKELLKDV